MDTQKKTRALIEASLMAAIAAILAIVHTYVPFLGFILYFIPVPFIILGKRHGIGFSILSVITAAVIVGSLTQPLTMFVILLPGIIAVVMGYMMNKQYSASMIFLGGSIAAIVSLILSNSLATAVSGMSMYQILNEVFTEAGRIQIEFMQSIGMDAANVEQRRIEMENMTKLILMIIPTLIIMGGVFFTYINYVLTVFILKRIGYKAEAIPPKLPPLKELRLPRSFLMGTLLIIILTALTRYLNIVHFDTLVVNIFLIFQFIFFIQGLAVILFFMSVYKASKLLRIVIFFFLLFNPMGAFMVAMIGLIDSFLNLRKLQSE